MALPGRRKVQAVVHFRGGRKYKKKVDKVGEVINKNKDDIYEFIFWM